MVLGEAVGAGAAHGDFLGQALLARLALVALAHLRRILKDALAHLLRHDDLAHLRTLRDVGLGLGHGEGGGEAVLLGHVLHDLGHAGDDLATRGSGGALQQAVGDDERIAPGD